ncbi:MAG: glycosyltransferase, partial [Lachnospiraceae bacterium]|nr:glycosyltransferase [Lachnospiraceae bacterium]
MKVSIVIPVYNVEKYLRLCLDSVLAQKFINFEAILVDDGSTDSSPAICDEYVKKDGRFKVIHQKNGGLSHARNIGIKHAVGDYVFFLDSDDCIHPLLLKKLTEIAEKYHAALVQTDIESVAEDFSDYEKEIDSDFTVYPFDTIDAFYNIDRDNKNITQDIRLITLVVWTKLYRRDLVEKIAFPEEIKLHEDQMVAHRFVVEGGGIVFCKAPLYFYRSRQGSLITEGWTVKRLVIFDCYKDRVEWAKKIQGDEKRVRDLVYYIYIRY